MRLDIQPKYETIAVTCACGNSFETKSTLCKPLHVEICSQCHPFYTGNQKVMDQAGKVEHFKSKFGKLEL